MLRRLTLAGTFVAYERFSAEAGPTEGFTSWEVIVRNLRTNQDLHKLPTGASTTGHFQLLGAGVTTAIALKRDGAVAWIVKLDRAPGEYQVWAADKAGNRPLASGPGIAPSSLALVGSTLHWTESGRPMSAPLN